MSSFIRKLPFAYGLAAITAATLMTGCGGTTDSQPSAQRDLIVGAWEGKCLPAGNGSENTYKSQKDFLILLHIIRLCKKDCF